MSKNRSTPKAFRTALIGSRCIYCGEFASLQDHFPPLTVSKHGWLLPSCAECNSIAGTEYPKNFIRRAEFVKNVLRKKYSKTLKTPIWEKQDIKELGYNLANAILTANKQKQIILARLNWDAEFYFSQLLEL